MNIIPDVHPSGSRAVFSALLAPNHAIVPCGIFMESGKFIAVNMVPAERFQAVWEDKVFAFLLKAERIFPEVVENMKSWKHSGFSVDNSVYVAADDTAGMQRLIEYIARCPFSLARIIKISD